MSARRGTGRPVGRPGPGPPGRILGLPVWSPVGACLMAKRKSGAGPPFPDRGRTRTAAPAGPGAAPPGDHHDPSPQPRAGANPPALTPPGSRRGDAGLPLLARWLRLCSCHLLAHFPRSF